MIKAGIAGLGWWGKTLVEGVADSKDIQFVAGGSSHFEVHFERLIYTGTWLTITNTGTTPTSIDLEIVLCSVPEPGSLALLGIGSAGLLGYSWRHRKRVA